VRKRRLQVAVAVVVAGGALAVVGAAVANWGDGRNIRESLSGFEEVPVVSTNASGDFKASIRRSAGEITYELSYADTTGDVSQAHIHLGQKSVNGGVSAWLCGNPSQTPPISPPPGTQPCPPGPATISGTITAENVVGPANQGIAAGEFEELVRAIRAGVTYVNVHSATFPGGEIRGQLGTHHDDDW
jgi:CHRD domain